MTFACVLFGDHSFPCFSQSDATRVSEVATEENVNDKTDGGLTGLHLCCVTGGKFSDFFYMII